LNIEQLEAGLPNGFHDARLRTYSYDPQARRAEFVLDVWLGDLHDATSAKRERRQAAVLELFDVGYFIADAPDPRYPANVGPPIQIDLCGPDDSEELARRVPAGGFANRFFVTEWNGFIRFAAREARLTWLGVN
jgi:hypothetical protein